MGTESKDTKKDEKNKGKKKEFEISNNILAPIITVIIFLLAFLFMKIDWDTMHSTSSVEPAAIVAMVDYNC